MRDGTSGPGGIEVYEAGFRVGQRIVDLDLALRLETPQVAGAEASETVGILDDLSRLLTAWSFLSDLSEDYTTIRDRLLEGEDPALLLDEARRLESDLEELLILDLDEDAYRLGKWATAGRLAAMTGDESFFTRGRNRRLLDQLREEVGDDAPPELGEISRRMRGDLDDEDLQRLHELLEGVIRRSGLPG